MSQFSRELAPLLDEVTEQLCEPASLAGLWHDPNVGMPSLTEMQEIMERLRSAIFPGYFGKRDFAPNSLRFHLAANLDSICRKLARQIVAGLCLDCANGKPCANCQHTGEEAALKFMRALPDIRTLLRGDAMAAYEGDPAATSPGETIFCYPSLKAMFHHRVAHTLHQLQIPIIPRIIAEMAHAATGIDIHPGARIGKNFFIDHGTGVVIGETCVIGQNCRLYQGVTLGALSFPKNEDGTLIKGIPRHPILEDNVIVYAGATILGRITIGKGAVIGGNVWITRDVPPGATISQTEHG